MLRKPIHPSAEHFKVLRPILRKKSSIHVVIQGAELPDKIRKRLSTSYGKLFVTQELAKKFFKQPAKKQQEWLRKARRRILYGKGNQIERAMEFLVHIFMQTRADQNTVRMHEIQAFLMNCYKKCDEEFKLVFRKNLAFAGIVNEVIYKDLEKDLLGTYLKLHTKFILAEALIHHASPGLLPNLRITADRTQEPDIKKSLRKLIHRLEQLS